MDDAPHKRYIIGDTETCGLGADKKACQVGLIEIDPITLDVLWEIESLIDPQWPMNPKASELNGITDEMLVDEPTMLEFVEHRLKGAGAGGQLDGSITLICHNVKFDEELLTPIGQIMRTICTLNESRHWITGPENFKLATLAQHFGFVPDVAHKALADCHTTRLVLKEIMRISGRTLDQLADVKDREVIRQPWGKHAGTLLHDVPASYLEWMLTKCEDLEPNLRKSAEKALALK